jgi:hypothetical protein
MRTVPVVAMDPAGEFGGADIGMGIDVGVSPLAQGGLDEALGLAVGAGSIRPGEDVLETEFLAGSGKDIGAEAGTVVGHDLLKLHPKSVVMGDGLVEESDGGDTLLIGQDGGMGQAGMIVDGDKDKVVAGSADGIATVAGDAKADAMDAGKLFNVEMEEIAGVGALVANDRHRRKKITPAVESGAAQQAGDGGAGKAGTAGDLDAGELLTAQGDDLLLAQERGRLAQPLGPGGTILESNGPTQTKTSQPLGDRAPTHPEGRCSGLQGESLFQNSQDHLLSTTRSENGMLMNVHGVASRGGSWFCTTPCCTPQPHEQPIEISQVAVAPLGLNESEDIIMVMAFSVGLAFTLVATGVVAAWSLRHAEKRFSGLGDVARKLPYLSSGILTLMAVYIGIQGWVHLTSHS